MSRAVAKPGLSADGYQRHTLHDESRLWVEKNCYVDVCIELLHALGLEPLAVMGGTVGTDFEGDNFTFFKPSHEDLRLLYGVDFQELNVWRPLLDHAEEHLSRGKFISTESDAFFLPDTEGTDYRRNHVKTTIILADVDRSARRLGYFHNSALHVLEGADFDGIFRVPSVTDPTALPLFAEVVRVDRLVRRSPNDLSTIARALLVRNLERRPEPNPVLAFQQRFARDLVLLQDRGLAYFHAWAFATLRQAGASFELLALHLQWLAAEGQGDGLRAAANAFARISAVTKTLVLKSARAVNTRKPLDATIPLREMAEAWEFGMTTLAVQLEQDPAELPA